MKRRTFLKTAAMGSLASSWIPALAQSEITHILTLSFDDGFRKSFLEMADIYEEFNLKACFNVIASGHLPEFVAADEYILPELMGNFEDWNGLVKRGHEVMPHGWKHAWLNRLPVGEAKELIARSIDYFSEHLHAFKPQEAVFNYPFNASTPELEAFTLTKIAALRTRGPAINPFPDGTQKILSCDSFGPNNADRWVKAKVKGFLKEPGGWMILNLHGLDGEGWGPISPVFLRKTLKKLSKVEHVAVMPTAQVLNQYRVG